MEHPVTMKVLEFLTDQDGEGAAPYPLLPVFSSDITHYVSYVHELATRVIPTAIAEDGASVEFGVGYYYSPTTGQLEPTPIPLTELAGKKGWNFPVLYTSMEITFIVYKSDRNPTTYSVTVSRRADPGRLTDLKVTIGHWGYQGAWTTADLSLTGSSRLVYPADKDVAWNTTTSTLWQYDEDSDTWTDTLTTVQPNAATKAFDDPGWVYETENYMVNFDSTFLGEYIVRIPYNAEKVLIEPMVNTDPSAGVTEEIIIAYDQFRQDPQYYPTPDAQISFADSRNPQYFWFDAS
jgi:hypothetical protein